MRIVISVMLIYCSLFGSNLENTLQTYNSQDVNRTISDIKLKHGLKANDNRDYKTAFHNLEPLANDNNSIAQLILGTMYYYGRCVEKNCSEAVKWYTKSSNQGNAQASYCLGELYYHGTEIQKNLNEAVKWYVTSANQGNVNAQSRLGYMYTYGEGIAVDYKEAIKWYTQAIKNGNRKAKCDICEPLLASANTAEIKKRTKELLRKAYNETFSYQCTVIYNRYELQNF